MLIADTIVTNPLNITIEGIIISLLFAISIAGVLTWMLRLPQETERARVAVRAVRSVNKQTRILVPLLGKNETTDRIVAIAAQMVRPRNGEVEMLAVIEVPFTLPLDAHVEADAKQALEVLEQANTVVKHCIPKNGLRVRRRILKARKAGVAIVREAEDQAVDMILMANIPVRIRGSIQQIDPAVEYVMKNAPCEVMVFSCGSIDPTYQLTTSAEPEHLVTTGAAH
ncbi:MAG TPA: universal stress protein [Ktedonobacteraceae bacterium]|nr:universal stress protein [Ktedonobacteraceae bacterium]